MCRDVFATLKVFRSLGLFTIQELQRATNFERKLGKKNMKKTCVPWSKVAILRMVIPPLIGSPYNGYINPYYWVDDHPLLYGNHGSLDTIAHVLLLFV